MRVLIVAAVLACAAAAPSGLLAAPYGHGLAGHGGLALAHGASLAVGHAAIAHAGPALPTISPGDIAGAAIDAHVEAHDHVRASVDAARELQGRAVNAAEDHSWQAIDAVKTQEAQLDGAAAGVAPVLAKQIAGHANLVAPVAYGAHGLAAGYGAHGLAAGYGAHGLAAGYGAHGVVSGHAIASSKTVVSQSLQQSHPAPVIHAPVAIAHSAPYAVAHGAPLAIAHGAHGYGLAGHGW
ncbi:unnamed protein product [Arctia plantaginis]|uniref:Uncharacterized protein n=1 Tax=Arctia plantaginis TaxID=874455 RepID=A0A8S1BS27_ARCPL|nr:unnamed protein product [Arctia plantaginis]